jgi:hypothetical protein
MRAMRNRTGPAVALVTVAALAGCGSLGTLSGRIEQPQVVTKAELARYPADSPERTVLAWWRALQFNSPNLATRYYSPRLKLTTDDLAAQLKAGPDFLDLKAGLRIVDVVTNGTSATVLAFRTRVLQHPNGRTDKVRVPQAVSLRRESGAWRLADNSYIDKAIENVQAFVDTAKGKGKGKEKDGK